MIEWVPGGMDASGALNSNLGGVVAGLLGGAREARAWPPSGISEAFGPDSGTPPRHLTISLPDR